MHPIQSWLRELLKLFVQYMAVAFCSIPATLVYFLVLKIGGTSNWAMTASLLTGFSSAYFAWEFLDTNLLHPELPIVVAESMAPALLLPLTPTSTGVTYAIGGPRLAAGFAVTVIVFSGIIPPDAVDLSQPTSRIAIRNTTTLLEV